MQSDCFKCLSQASHWKDLLSKQQKKYDDCGRELIGIEKYTDRTYLWIFYIDSGFSFYDLHKKIDITNLSSIERLEDKKLYVFIDHDKRSKPDDIEFLYWHVIMVLSNT